MADLQVARTILEQLGGSRFKTMTGARDFVGGDNYLLFRLPARFARGGINKVMITLEASDLYTLDFLKCNFAKHTSETVNRTEGVYDDALQRVFTEVTGLDTHL